MPPLLDTNVLLRHLLQDLPEHSGRASAFVRRLERGEETAILTDTVLFEAVFLLEKHYRRSRGEIRDAILGIVNLPTVELDGKQRLPAIFALYVGSSLSYADAYHAVIARALPSAAIVSFDRGFDRVPGLRRIEP